MTFTFANSGKVTSYFVEQNVWICASAPGSCAPKSFEGNPSTTSPRSR